MRRVRRARGPVARVALGLAALTLAGQAAAAAPRAAGGRDFIEAAERAPLVIDATVGEWLKIDDRGYRAFLEVSDALVGDVPRGTLLTVVWEERAIGRAPRFKTGERVVIVLEPLEVTTLWRQRLPDPAKHLKVLQVAARSEAFVREPSLATGNALRHYLKLRREDRLGPTGAGFLAQLAARAQPPLAVGAVNRLRAHRELLAPGGRDLVTALLREEPQDELRDAVLELLAARRFESVRPPLEELAEGEPPPPAVVFQALGLVAGGLPPERTLRLLAVGGTAQRAAAARFASGPKADAQLEWLLARDPEAQVRAAAVERLVEIRGMDALDPAAAALEDPDPAVRGQAAQSLGSLGADAVPRLSEVAETGSFEAAQAAVLGLRVSGAREGQAALVVIARDHSNEKIRNLAGLALGRALPSDEH